MDDVKSDAGVSVVQLTEDADAIPEVPVGLKRTVVSAGQGARGRPVKLDLSKRRKVWFCVGRGRTGKTTLIRWMAEKAAAASAPVVCIDMDRTNAALTSYIEGVQSLPTVDDAAGAQWLQRGLDSIVRSDASALVDLGGGDTILMKLVEEVPSLAGTLGEAGLEVVLSYLLGPQPDDLSPLATFAELGFMPRATVLVLNEGLLGPGVSADTGFDVLRRHSVFRKAEAAGAAIVRFPRLSPAAEIERRRVHFAQARDGQGPAPLGPFDRARIRHWLERMDEEFAPIASWMP
ncbi:MAG: hypothetical protein ACREFP_11705 [Acetobacteraceae bacterium]